MEISLLNKSNDSWCQFSALPKPQILLRRFDDSCGGRFYFWEQPEEGQLVVKTGIGITSLLSIVLPTSPFLTRWKLENQDWEKRLDASSTYGTFLHMCFSEWLINRNIPKEYTEEARKIAVEFGQTYDMIDKDIIAFLKWVDDYKVYPLLSEAMLASEPIKGESYCLTIDLLCELYVDEIRTEQVQDGFWQRGELKGQPKMVENKIKEKVKKFTLVDFKSNFSEKESKSFFTSHFYQLIGAQKAMKYNYPDVPIDIIANFSANSWRTNPSYSFKIWEVKDTDLKLFDLYIEIARLQGLFSPSGNKFVAPEFIDGVKYSDYKILTYQEYAEQVLLAQQVEAKVEEIDTCAE